MRMNYKIYPTDYINELLKNGQRKKAIAFMSYWHDMEHEVKNSMSFYGKAFGVAKSTAHIWVDDFKKEVSLFLDHWELKNMSQYNYVKKTIGRLPNSQSDDYTSTPDQDYGNCSTTVERSIGRQSNEDINIYDDDGDAKKEFEKLFYIYNNNGGFTGDKERAFLMYKQKRLKIDLDELVISIGSYLNDGNVEKKYNIENFFKNEI